MNNDSSMSINILNILLLNCVIYIKICKHIKSEIIIRSLIKYLLLSSFYIFFMTINANLFFNTMFFLVINLIALRICLNIEFKKFVIPFLFILILNQLVYNFFKSSEISSLYNKIPLLNEFLYLFIPLITFEIIHIVRVIFKTNIQLHDIHLLNNTAYYLVSIFSIIIYVLLKSLKNLMGLNNIVITILVLSSLALFFAYLKLLSSNYLMKIENASLMDCKKNLETLNKDLRALRHDFRNHLQVISGLIQLKKYEDCFNYLKNINNTSQEFQCVKSGLISVNALLNSKQLVARNNNIKLDLEINTRLDSENLSIKDWEITRILGNLIDNAIYEESKVSTSNKYVKVELDENKYFYSFSVYNKNSYINADKKKRIFDSGFSTKGDKGTGMGLYIVDEIVNNHNGYLELDSDINNGTKFNIYFPKDIKNDILKSYPPQKSILAQN